MSEATGVFRMFWLLFFLATGGIDLAVASPAAQTQSSHAGPVTGVIDGVQFQRDQYYVSPGFRQAAGPCRCRNWAATATRSARRNTSAIRTANIEDASSWRGWDGKGFNVVFADPYRGPVADPAAHLCVSVPNIEFLTGFNYHEASHLFVGTQFSSEETAYGPPGVYFTTSPDFVHWSKPALALTLNQMLRREPEGSWSYMYFSLIDPRSTDSSFMTITDAPYLYYVRMDDNHGPYQRVLFRQKIKLNWLTKGRELAR